MADVMARRGDYIPDMNRRTAILAPLAFLALGMPAFAAPIPLGDLSKYLNGLSSFVSDFTQINADGTIATGKVFIRRPGRARFEYTPPDKSLVIAGAGQVAIFDSKSNQLPETYPLARTPLNLILANNINLGRAKMVVGHREVENTTRVVAQDPENPSYGTIELVFTKNPVELRQWIITDDAGSKTTVILGDMQKGAKIPGAAFDIVVETGKRVR